MTPLEHFLVSILVKVAGSVSAEVIKRNLFSAIEEGGDSFRDALAPRRTLREEVAAACTLLATQRDALKLSSIDPMWPLLNSQQFQTDLSDWLMVGDLQEGQSVRGRLKDSISAALLFAHAPQQQIKGEAEDILDSIERGFFSNSVLAHWRHQRSLDYLRDQVSKLRQFAEEAAGQYGSEKTDIAINKYCEVALRSWDIIDLSGLPEADRNIATQRLLLRQLYMPLRLKIVVQVSSQDHSSALEQAEAERSASRLAEAGRLSHSTKQQKAEIEATVGQRLVRTQRLVVLGDPGGGNAMPSGGAERQRHRRVCSND